MPFIIQKTDSCPVSKPYGVFTETGHGTGKTKGSPHGCFPSAAAAREQQKALYANVPDARHSPSDPPNLRDSENNTQSCANCTMYWKGKPKDVTANDSQWAGQSGQGLCWGYGNFHIRDQQVCDSFEPDSSQPGPEANSAGTEVPMTTTALMPHTVEWRVERARALSESQRKRPEQRQIHEPLELREADENGVRVLRSYASLFNVPYTVRAAGYRFEETVKPGAFKRTLGTNPDVVFRYDHSGPPLARTSSGTLRLGEDERGLWYEADLNPEDPDVKALIPKIERGDLNESSFAFRVGSKGDKWNEEHDKRDILACELDRGDVSVVTFGASRATGQHMLLRSEEAMAELQEIGFTRFLQAWMEWRDWSVLPEEVRIGKALSAETMDTLRHVLTLVAAADDAVDEAEAMLADFLGVANPDADDDESTEKPVTGSEQLGTLGRTEEEEESKEEESQIAEIFALPYWLCNDHSDVPAELRADLSAAGRKKMADKGQARPDGSFPIPNVEYLKKAIRAYGRAGNKAAAKAWIKKRAAALGATNLLPEGWRYERTTSLARNDTQDLTDLLKLRGR